MSIYPWKTCGKTQYLLLNNALKIVRTNAIHLNIIKAMGPYSKPNNTMGLLESFQSNQDREGSLILSVNCISGYTAQGQRKFKGGNMEQWEIGSLREDTNSAIWWQKYTWKYSDLIALFISYVIHISWHLYLFFFSSITEENAKQSEDNSHFLKTSWIPRW